MAFAALIGLVLLVMSTKKASASATPTNASEYTKRLSFINNAYYRFYDALFKKYATQYGVNWHWAKAICIQESRLATDPRTAAGEVSYDGKSWGIAQFTLPTAIDMVGAPILPAWLNVPENSIKICCKYIGVLSKAFPGDTRKIIMSYNQGPGNTRAGKEYAAEYFESWALWLKVVQNNP